MIERVFPYFLDELTKISVQLSKKEKAQLYGQYAALGAVSYPAVSSLGHRIEKGSFFPTEGSKLRRLGAGATIGLIGGAAVPALRLHFLKRKEDQARHRLLEEKLRREKPMTEKSSASKEMAKYQQTRKGRRPIRVSTLLKKAAPLPWGGVSAVGTVAKGSAAATTKGTVAAAGSVAPSGRDAFSKLPKPRARVSSAEVGPLPKKKKASVEFDMIENDPLVQYLKKHAAEDKPPLKGLVDSEGILSDNLENMPKGKDEAEQTSMCPCPTPQMEAEVKKSWQPYLDQMFENREGIKKKYTDKDHEPGSGIVDRALGTK